MIIKHGRQIFWEIHEVRKDVCGLFFSWLCFSDADWLGRQTLITWCYVHSSGTRSTKNLLCTLLAFNWFFARFTLVSFGTHPTSGVIVWFWKTCTPQTEVAWCTDPISVGGIARIVCFITVITQVTLYAVTFSTFPVERPAIENRTCKQRLIGDFWVAFRLCFKVRPRCKAFHTNESKCTCE